jgi:hypothetical protein
MGWPGWGTGKRRPAQEGFACRAAGGFGSQVKVSPTPAAQAEQRELKPERPGWQSSRGEAEKEQGPGGQGHGLVEKGKHSRGVPEMTPNRAA